MKDHTVETLTATIGERYRPHVRELQQGLYTDAAEYLNPANPPGINVKSLTDRFLNLSVVVSVVRPAQPPESHAIVVSVAGLHRKLMTAMRAPRLEADAWACAIFGEGRADHAYYLGQLARRPDGSPAALYYRLYIGADNTPQDTPPASEAGLTHHPLKPPRADT